MELDGDKPTLNDADLLRRLAQGSRAALAALFEGHYQALLAYGLKMGSAQPAVEDAVQDVFFNLWQARARAASVASARGYLFAALRRRLLKTQSSDQRRALRNQRYQQAEESFQLSPEDFLIHDELRAEHRRVLAAALQRLSKRQQEALYLRFYGGLRYSEIAEVMEVREQTARNYVFEAIQLLRKECVILVNS